MLTDLIPIPAEINPGVRSARPPQQVGFKAEIDGRPSLWEALVAKAIKDSLLEQGPGLRVRIREDGFWRSQSAFGANAISPEGSHKRSFCKA